tara:strand:- start:438 stop:626 length:189 start_codon:yes stop_codon:yes gene_type:complete
MKFKAIGEGHLKPSDRLINIVMVIDANNKGDALIKLMDTFRLHQEIIIHKWNIKEETQYDVM